MHKMLYISLFFILITNRIGIYHAIKLFTRYKSLTRRNTVYLPMQPQREVCLHQPYGLKVYRFFEVLATYTGILEVGGEAKKLSSF